MLVIGFCTFYEAIDDLFEDDDNDNITEEEQDDAKDLKVELLEYIEDIAKLAEEEGQQKCGLDCSELEQERVLEVVSELESQFGDANELIISCSHGSTRSC